MAEFNGFVEPSKDIIPVVEEEIEQWKDLIKGQEIELEQKKTIIKNHIEYFKEKINNGSNISMTHIQTSFIKPLQDECDILFSKLQEMYIMLYKQEEYLKLCNNIK